MKSKFSFAEFKTSNVPIAIQKVVIPQGTQYPQHEHDFVEIVYIVKGAGTHIFENNPYPIHQGDVYVIEPGQKHAYEVDKNEEMIVYNCIFLPSIITRSFSPLLQMDAFIEFYYLRPFIRLTYHFVPVFTLKWIESTKIKMMFDSLYEEFTTQKAGYELMLQIKFIELLVQLSRSYMLETQLMDTIHSENGDRVIETICKYIETNFSTPATIEQLCHMAGFSASHLSHMFKQKTGQSIQQYYQNIRVEQACSLLAETLSPISTIAMDVGFNDISFFNKVFKRKKGCTPLEYRSRFA